MADRRLRMALIRGLDTIPVIKEVMYRKYTRERND